MLRSALPSSKTRKSYKTVANAKAALEKFFAGCEPIVRYAIHVDEETGRFFPVLIGAENIRFVHAGFAVVA